MIKTPEKHNIKLSSQHNNTLKLHKSYIFNKNVSVLASLKIKTPINYYNFVNIDIKATPCALLNNTKDYVISFTDYDYLDLLKDYMKHPYSVSKTKVSDLSYYLERMDYNLLVINDVECDNITKLVKYTAFNIEIDKLMDGDTEIPVSIHKFNFGPYFINEM